MGESTARLESKFALLKERTKALASEKARLHMLTDLANRLNAIAGTDRVSEKVLRTIGAAFGGVNSKLFYFRNGEFTSNDDFGKPVALASTDIAALRKVLETAGPIEVESPVSGRTPEPHVSKTGWVPLTVGSEWVGVVGIENPRVPILDLWKQSRAALAFAALLLKNDIATGGAESKPVPGTPQQTETKSGGSSAEAFRSGEEKYRTLIQKLQTAIVVHSADTKIVTCNSVAQSILGLTEDQLIGKAAVDPAWHFYREDGTPMPIEEFPVNRAISERTPVRNLVVGVHRPGHAQDVWTIVNADPVFERGTLAEVIVTFIDVTDRKQAQERAAYLAAIVESTDDAIIGKTLDERILSWNPGAERLYGYSAEEIIGQPVSTLVPPDRQHELAAIMEKLHRGERIQHLETIRVHKDGQLLHVALTVSPIRDSKRQIIGASVISRDISQEKRAEEEIRQLNAELERRVAERTAALELKNKELEQMIKVFVGREKRMVELKERIRALTLTSTHLDSST